MNGPVVKRGSMVRPTAARQKLIGKVAPVAAEADVSGMMMSVTRSLSPRERAALDALLAADFGGAPELRSQAESVLASNDGMVVDLVVDRALPTAAVVHRVPVQAVVDGADYDGGLILYVEEGRLSGLEYWWVTEDKPEDFPPVSAVGRPVVAG
jgi:hypothetical protein